MNSDVGSPERDIEEVLHERAVALARPEGEETSADLLQVLLLRLAEEWYAVDVGHVREVLHGVEITRVPCAPAHVVGVLSLRGEIVSVCDLRSILGLSSGPRTGHALAIVVEADEIATAILADDVAGIAEMPSDEIEPTLTTIDRTAAEYVVGETTIDTKLVGILNLQHLVRAEED